MEDELIGVVLICSVFFTVTELAVTLSGLARISVELMGVMISTSRMEKIDQRCVDQRCIRATTTPPRISFNP